MQSLIYVSRSNILPDALKRTIQDILVVSLARNSQLGVTGALISTPLYFAQLLEGHHDHLDELMQSIAADQRHRDILLIERNTMESRRFERWQMVHVEAPRMRHCRVQHLLAGIANGDLAAGQGAKARMQRLFQAIAQDAPFSRK